MYYFKGYNVKSTNSIYLGHRITVTFLLLMQVKNIKGRKKPQVKSLLNLYIYG